MRRLELNGLTTLSEKAAQALSMHIGYLELNGLINISDHVFEILSNHMWSISLHGVKTLSDNAAIALSKRMKWNYIDLPGVETISDFALGIIGDYIRIEINIESPSILGRLEKCILEKNERQFEKVLVKDLNNEKLIGRKIGARIAKFWTEDFIAEDTGETVSINKTEIILEAKEILTKKNMTKIINSGFEVIFLEKESN